MTLCCSVFGAKAQNNTSTGVAKDNIKTDANALVVKFDSIAMEYIDAIYWQLVQSTPRYKMYPTDNTRILLKLDSGTGKVWMVQYATGNEDGVSVPVDDSSLLYSWETVRPGRFELYPTQNMYNFILLDTKYGYTYQVQWHQDKENRMRVRIY